MEQTLSRYQNSVGLAPQRQVTSVRIRTVALPIEHGGWGLLLEPIALGLLVAPSVAGIFLSLAAGGAFLARHPLRLASADRRRGRRFPRTRVAEQFVLLYGAIAIIGVLATAAMATSFEWFWPLAAAAPFAALQIVLDAKGRGRQLVPELAGAIALAATAPSIALAAGWPRPAAFALWALMVARGVPAIIYVRQRLNMLQLLAPVSTTTMILHTAAVAVALAFAFTNLYSSVTCVAFVVLLLRAAYGLSGLDQARSAKAIGMREILFGALTVLTIAIDHWLLA